VPGTIRRVGSTREHARLSATSAVAGPPAAAAPVGREPRLRARAALPVPNGGRQLSRFDPLARGYREAALHGQGRPARYVPVRSVRQPDGGDRPSPRVSGTTGNQSWSPTPVRPGCLDRGDGAQLRACGIHRGDIVQNAYGYGLFTGGLGMHYGGEALGATVIPISGGNTERQLMVMADFGVTACAARRATSSISWSPPRS